MHWHRWWVCAGSFIDECGDDPASNMVCSGAIGGDSGIDVAGVMDITVKRQIGFRGALHSLALMQAAKLSGLFSLVFSWRIFSRV